MKMKCLVIMAACGLALCSIFLTANPRLEEKTHKLTTVSTRKMADSLHSVIASDRQTYSEWVDRQSRAGGPLEMPVHAKLLRKAAQNIQQQGAEFSYTLRSLWPLNPNHGPQTQVEQTGMEFVMKNPGQNYYTEETLGGRSYFTAVYADKAVYQSCVDCHNRHPQAVRKDFKINEAMGAIIVRVPLEF